MKLGFLGTGTIAEAVLTGLCTGADPPPTVVSPRMVEPDADPSMPITQWGANW